LLNALTIRFIDALLTRHRFYHFYSDTRSALSFIRKQPGAPAVERESSSIAALRGRALRRCKGRRSPSKLQRVRVPCGARRLRRESARSAPILTLKAINAELAKRGLVARARSLFVVVMSGAFGSDCACLIDSQFPLPKTPLRTAHVRLFRTGIWLTADGQMGADPYLPILFVQPL
jgi:hypothetical protein